MSVEDLICRSLKRRLSDPEGTRIIDRILSPVWDEAREGIQISTHLFFDRRLEYYIFSFFEDNEPYPADSVHRSVLRSLR